MKKVFVLSPDKYREAVKQNLFDFINSLPVDKTWAIEVRPNKKPQSLKQLKSLYGVAYEELREQTGNDKDDLHKFFCGEYFGWTHRNVFGYTEKVPVRTTTINENGEYEPISTEDNMRFYNFVQKRAAENGYIVSDPDPFLKH